jgi:hypothetical protein
VEREAFWESVFALIEKLGIEIESGLGVLAAKV